MFFFFFFFVHVYHSCLDDLGLFMDDKMDVVDCWNIEDPCGFGHAPRPPAMEEEKRVILFFFVFVSSTSSLSLGGHPVLLV